MRPPGIYFRLLLVGYFEGIDSERGIAWRAADSFALRDSLGIGLDSAPVTKPSIHQLRAFRFGETTRQVIASEKLHRRIVDAMCPLSGDSAAGSVLFRDTRGGAR
jgi:hypothetical protein